MYAVWHLLDRESLTDNMGKADGGVCHISSDFLTEHLPVGIPDNRILIHRHTGILGIENQGIADSLHVVAESTDMRIGMHLAIYRIGIDMIGIDAHGI